MPFCPSAIGLPYILPEESVIKAIDVWEVMCIALVFAGMLEFALMHTMLMRRKKMKIAKEMEEKLKNESQETDRDYMVYILNLKEWIHIKKCQNCFAFLHKMGNFTRKGFALKFFPFRVDPFSEGACYGLKQTWCHKIVLLMKNGGKRTKFIQFIL